MKIYFKDIDNVYSGKIGLDHPSDPEVIDLLINKELGNICDFSSDVDAIIISKQQTIKGNLLVTFKFIDYHGGL